MILSQCCVNQISRLLIMLACNAIDQCFGDEDRRHALVVTLPNGNAYLSTSQTAAVTYDLRSPLFQTADYILPSFEQASEAGKSFCESATASDAEPRHQSSITLEVAP